MKKQHIYTISLGCPKNLVDTERMLGTVSPYFTPVADIWRADVVLINTCGFIQEAVEESIEEILNVCEEVKAITPPPLIVVTGCLLKRYGDALIQEIPEVDLWIPLERQHKLGEILLKMKKIPEEEDKKIPRIITTGPSYAYLKIAEGCNHRCSFCTIPSIRGPFVSLPLNLVLDEAKRIVDMGIKEVIVVAQDLTYYGTDLGNKGLILELLKRISEIKGLHWLRLLYLYPAGITRGLLEVLKDISPPFIPYFDIPFQHSHPDILRKMGRPFKREPQSIIEDIRSFFPDAAIRTSIIVGFPGEEERHFNHLVNWIEKTKFTHLGVFTYSDEEGTRAYSMRPKVDEEIKKQRRQVLMEIQKEISRGYLQGLVGREMEVIIDHSSEQWPTLFEGRTWFQAPEIDGKSYVSGLNIRPGDLVKVQIEDSWDYDLCGIV